VNFEEAARLLDARAPGSPAFVLHSHVVADVATRVGRALREARPGVELERIRVRALLHDYGRSRTHGPYHGWVGYALLRHAGLGEYGRGCVTHWLRGLGYEETLALSKVKPRFLRRVFEELSLPEMTLDDYVVSVADFTAANTTIVSMEDREADLVKRYSDSPWIRRTASAARAHRDEIERLTGRAFSDLVPGTAPAGRP
jgi:hypothetical protein